MIDECWTTQNDALYLHIKVNPGASKNEVLDVREGRLRLRIAAAPEDGKANTALITLLAKLFACPKNTLSIHAGEKSRLKTIRMPLTALERIKELDRF
ncbi:MAG: DUF167 domain-containing protein [Spirochaetaceae bacterium]|jgi:uncharacterized protein (TIGR00251 family)|nr:DUF167 domain-containing protein [Spirochaetaceae bacterium]